jgi:hypothetical protein
MDAASTSETSASFYQVTSLKTAIFVLAAVRTSTLTLIAVLTKALYWALSSATGRAAA